VVGRDGTSPQHARWLMPSLGSAAEVYLTLLNRCRLQMGKRTDWLATSEATTEDRSWPLMVRKCHGVWKTDADREFPGSPSKVPLAGTPYGKRVNRRWLDSGYLWAPEIGKLVI
jgi:hypothetical protein